MVFDGLKFLLEFAISWVTFNNFIRIKGESHSFVLKTKIHFISRKWLTIAILICAKPLLTLISGIKSLECQIASPRAKGRKITLRKEIYSRAKSSKYSEEMLERSFYIFVSRRKSILPQHQKLHGLLISKPLKG